MPMDFLTQKKEKMVALDGKSKTCYAERNVMDDMQ